MHRLLAAALPLLLFAVGAAAQPAALPLAERYHKTEHTIPTRDGTRLYAAVYTPRDASAERRYPLLIKRTPYSCRPYGEGAFPERIGPSPVMEAEGYIFVCADVRGRWMSEGAYDNMRPHVPGDSAIDESSDTYDTIEYLLNHVPHHNGRVGQWGISYPGFYTAAALPEAHPALAASSPQAPIADFFFDDFHHHGAYLLSYFMITPLFGIQHEGPTTEAWYREHFVEPHTPDAYQFFKDLGPLSNADSLYGPENFFWQQLTEHPNYDAFWQRRSILPHLTDVDHAVLTVGGWFDAEDLYGPLHIYQTLERENPGIYNALVMGPFSHGQWARGGEETMVGDIHFGTGLSTAYQRDVEAPFFRHFLKGEGRPPSFEAYTFDTGARRWHAFADWPPRAAETRRLYLRADERLRAAPPAAGETAFTEYLSDPDEPVPFIEEHRMTYTPRAYMTDDQRFAERRPDVIEFVTEPLEEPLTLAGPLLARLMVSTTGTDADWVVKLVDVYPDSMQNTPHTPEGVVLSGYQQMVRSDVMRGRFRDSYEHPAPFEPGAVTEVRLPLQDVFHTFGRGHRLMVQIQSTWFPLIDRNPQTFVPNIFEATEDDFRKATHRVYHTPETPTYLEVQVLP